MGTVYTVGHGTRTIEELIGILLEAGAEVVVDVRRFPGSRRHPHFARESLERSLPGAGVAYEWWGEELGGRRSPPKEAASRHASLRVAAFRNFADHMDSPAFERALTRLRDRCAQTSVAIMCAETLWWRCHRRMISDALVVGGAEVVHLVAPGTSQPHKLFEVLRLDEQGRLCYDAGSLPGG
ncbi:DUF488 domain-containing protein [soil metagenome]